MAQARADIQHERERLAEEVDSRTRRSREECDYKVDLERLARLLILHYITITSIQYCAVVHQGLPSCLLNW